MHRSMHGQPPINPRQASSSPIDHQHPKLHYTLSLHSAPQILEKHLNDSTLAIPENSATLAHTSFTRSESGPQGTLMNIAPCNGATSIASVHFVYRWARKGSKERSWLNQGKRRRVCTLCITLKEAHRTKAHRTKKADRTWQPRLGGPKQSSARISRGDAGAAAAAPSDEGGGAAVPDDG